MNDEIIDEVMWGDNESSTLGYPVTLLFFFLGKQICKQKKKAEGSSLTNS
jgi:hypothetical protein